MKKFEYLRPKTVDEAISLLESHGEKGRYIAGGTDVIVKIKERKLTPDYLISLRHIPDLAYIHRDPEGLLRLGALTTHRMLEQSSLLRRYYPCIFDAVENIGSVQIRNVATIGGISVSRPFRRRGDPFAHFGRPGNPGGTQRETFPAAKKLFSGAGPDPDGAGEILTEFFIPPLPANSSGGYVKHTRREAMELPIVGVGCFLALSPDLKTCAKARIGLGVAAPTLSGLI